MKRKGITLIGMPASGKSTIGKQLAKSVGFPMLDIDRWMERQEGSVPLWQLIRTKGAQYVLELETDCVRNHDLHETVLSPPGSIIYNDVLQPLREQTHIIYLEVPFKEIKARLDADTVRQGEIIGIKEKGLDGLFAERTPLYEKWAQHTIKCSGKSVTQLVDEIVKIVS